MDVFPSTDVKIGNLRDNVFCGDPYQQPSLQNAQRNALKPNKNPECGNEFCFLGCICESLRLDKIVRGHCGKARCQFVCICRVKRLPKRFEEGSKTVNKKKRRKAVTRKRNSKTRNSPLMNQTLKSDTKRKSESEDGNDSVTMAGALSDDSGKGSFSSASSPQIPLIILDDSDDDVYMVENESESRDEDSLPKLEKWRKMLCQPCRVRTVPANLDLPIEKIEALCAPRVNYAEDNMDGLGMARRLHIPSPQLKLLEEEDRTICVITENHKAIVNWSKRCQMPRIANSAVHAHPSITFKTIITLPIPPLNQTFYLFGIPSWRDGVVLFCVRELQFQLPLGLLHDSVKSNKRCTQRFPLVNSDGKLIRTVTGQRCYGFFFPTLPSVLVVGPLPVAPPPAGPRIMKSSIANDKSGSTGGKMETYGAWNGDGERIPRDYYENVFRDFMIEYPEMDH